MKKWYLINSSTSPNMTSGFENEPFIDWKEDAFSESLQTEIASTVILYNYDLSISKKVRCIVQDNTANTQLKSMERTLLFPIGTVKAGMYVFFENCYWLITGFPGNNKIYEKVTAILCQYKLRWQNERGCIVERWCNTVSASKYDVGESGNNIMMLTSDNLTLLLPDDDESLDLDGKRVFIDKRKYNPTKVYKITRTDGTLYDYGMHGGVIAFIADKTEFNPDVDNQELRICDYVEFNHLSNNLKSKLHSFSCIINGNPELKTGFSRIYSLDFKHEQEKESWNKYGLTWNVKSDFLVNQIIKDNKIELSVNDENYIGSSFLLQCKTSDGHVVAEITITVVAGF